MTIERTFSELDEQAEQLERLSVSFDETSASLIARLDRLYARVMRPEATREQLRDAIERFYRTARWSVRERSLHRRHMAKYTSWLVAFTKAKTELIVPRGFTGWLACLARALQ